MPASPPEKGIFRFLIDRTWVRSIPSKKLTGLHSSSSILTISPHTSNPGTRTGKLGPPCPPGYGPVNPKRFGYRLGDATDTMIMTVVTDFCSPSLHHQVPLAMAMLSPATRAFRVFTARRRFRRLQSRNCVHHFFALSKSISPKHHFMQQTTTFNMEFRLSLLT